jgi:hypothetical protein
MTIGNVLCTSTHPVDLDSGKVLGPGEHALSIDLDHPHNADVIANGHLIVIGDAPVITPRTESGEPHPSTPSVASAPSIPATSKSSTSTGDE